jgi:hypothetical protein
VNVDASPSFVSVIVGHSTVYATTTAGTVAAYRL